MPERGATRLQVGAAFAAIYVVWGSTYLAIRFAIETLPPFLMAGVRFLAAGAILYTWTRLRGTPAPAARHWRSAAIVGGLLLLGGNGGVVWSEQRVASGLAALLVATVPLWVVGFEALGLGGAVAGHRLPAPRVLVGVGLGLLGVALLVGPGRIAGGPGADPLGAGVLVLASMSWAAGSLYSRRAALPASPFLATAMEMLAGGALLTLAGIATGEVGRLDLAAASARSLAAFGYLVGMGSLVGFTAYIWLLRVERPARVATYAYVNPVVAMLLGWALADEPLSARTLLAAAVIVAAVVAITTARARLPESRETAVAGVAPATPLRPLEDCE